MNIYCRLPFGQFDPSNEHIREVAEKMDRTPGSLSMKLCNLASLDSYHKERDVVGLKGASRLDREVWEKFQSNWSIMAEKSEEAFDVLMNRTVTPESAMEILMPDGPSETKRTVKARRLQRFFRGAVLGSYENRCALTGMPIPQLLIASHIIPWSENEERRNRPR